MATGRQYCSPDRLAAVCPAKGWTLSLPEQVVTKKAASCDQVQEAERSS
ncbi:TPA: hypothetical protein OMI62_004674 [Escherichia coli]|nr:hypothetical protein [Escherichia coli]HCQ9044559.1 hypothetical protein [Escherichia coli]